MMFGQNQNVKPDHCLTCGHVIIGHASLPATYNYCRCTKVQRPASQDAWRHKQADELAALRAFVREVSQQDPAQVPGQRQSNKERAEDLCEQWRITE